MYFLLISTEHVRQKTEQLGILNTVKRSGNAVWTCCFRLFENIAKRLFIVVFRAS